MLLGTPGLYIFVTLRFQVQVEGGMSCDSAASLGVPSLGSSRDHFRPTTVKELLGISKTNLTNSKTYLGSSKKNLRNSKKYLGNSDKCLGNSKTCLGKS